MLCQRTSLPAGASATRHTCRAGTARMSVVRCSASQDAPSSSGNVCRTCGVDLSKAPAGCDGQGRVMGGLAAIPGFGWWPIKAYKPCSALNEAGLEYTRKGQGTNEMLFGGVSLGESQQKSLEAMQQTADKGLEIEVEAKK